MTATAIADKPSKLFVYRHTVLVRITHWINVVAITFLVMSGLQIFNAHPALYWGKTSTFDKPILSMTAEDTDNGDQIGQTKIFGWTFNTTGLFGLSNTDARWRNAAFPGG